MTIVTAIAVRVVVVAACVAIPEMIETSNTRKRTLKKLNDTPTRYVPRRVAA